MSNDQPQHPFSTPLDPSAASSAPQPYESVGFDQGDPRSVPGNIAELPDQPPARLAAHAAPTPDKFDVNKLTLGEIGIIENMSGQPLAALSDSDKPKAKLMVALAYVIGRRGNQNYTFADAEAMTLEQITDMLDMGDDDDEEPSPQS